MQEQETICLPPTAREGESYDTAEGARDDQYDTAESGRAGQYATAESGKRQITALAEDARDDLFDAAGGGEKCRFKRSQNRHNATPI